MNSTEICNMALSYIGNGRINSIDDAAEDARKCKIHYDHDRRRMLAAYSWGFAKRIERLALFTSDVFVYDKDGARKKEEAREDFEIVTLGGQKAIATDVRDAWAEYTADVRDANMFSEEFTEGLTHLLASSIAMGITGNANIAMQHMQLAQQSVVTAKQYNVLEKERRMRYPNKYANERFT